MSATLNWTQVQTRPILMIPGPTELPWPVVQALNQPPSIQYDRSFDEGVLEPTTLALRDVFQTRNEVILLPGSGRTALEAGALSVIEPGDRVLVVGAGQFGLLMREIMKRVGAEWTEFPVELGARLDLDRLAREAERAASQGHHARAQRDLDRRHLPGRRGRQDRALGRKPLHARHRIVHRRHRRAHRRVGRGPEHDRLAEVPGRAARPVAGEREPAGLGGHGAAQEQGALLRLRPAALEGVVGAGLARRQRARRRTAPPAGVHPDPSHRGDARRGAADPRGGPRPALPSSRAGRRARCAPA